MPLPNTNRTEELDEILSSPPGGFVLYGSITITLFILLLGSISLFISYPDKLNSTGNIGPENPPIILNSNAGGELLTLTFKNGEQVKQGDIIGTFKNTTDTAALDYAGRVANMIQENITGLPEFYPINPDTTLILGDLSNTYYGMVSAWKELQSLNDTKIFEKRSQSIKATAWLLKQNIAVSKRKNKLTEKEYENAVLKFETEKKLYEKGAISKMDFIKAEGDFLSAGKAFEAGKEQINALELQLEAMLKQQIELEFEEDEKQRTLKENIFNAIYAISDFKNKLDFNYSISAPEGGRLFYIGNNIEINRHFQPNKPMFYILPEYENLIYSGNLPAEGIGKINKGNRVQIELPSFPPEEYGYLNGTVMLISDLPQDSSYRIKVKLDTDLQTDIGKKIPFTPEMQARATIFTKEYTLARRFLLLFTGKRI